MDDKEDGNGKLTPEELDEITKHALFVGGKIGLKDLSKEDGHWAKFASSQNRGTQSVLQRTLNAVDDEHYREIGLRAFDDPIKARLAANAINELDYFGLPIKLMVDVMTFEASSVIGNFMNWLRDNLTHSEYTIKNVNNKNKNNWLNRNKENAITQSPTDES